MSLGSLLITSLLNPLFEIWNLSEMVEKGEIWELVLCLGKKSMKIQEVKEENFC